MDVLSNRPRFIVQYRLHLCLLLAVKSLMLFVFETSVRSNLAPSADREEKSVNQYLAAEITQLFFGWTPRIRTAVVDEKTCVTLEPPVRPSAKAAKSPRREKISSGEMRCRVSWRGVR